MADRQILPHHEVFVFLYKFFFKPHTHTHTHTHIYIYIYIDFIRKNLQSDNMTINVNNRFQNKNDC